MFKTITSVWEPAECGLNIIKSERNYEEFHSMESLSDWYDIHGNFHAPIQKKTYKIDVDSLGFNYINKTRPIDEENLAVLRRIFAFMEMIYVKRKIIEEKAELPLYFYKTEGHRLEELPYKLELEKTELELRDTLGYDIEEFKDVLTNTVDMLAKHNRKVIFIDRTNWRIEPYLSEYGRWDWDYTQETGKTTLFKGHSMGIDAYRRLGVGVVE